MPAILGLLAVLFLVLLNGFFAAAEFALVAIRRSRVDQLVAEGRRGAGIVKQAIEHLDSYVAATQLGITIASLGLGWIGEPALARLVEPLLAIVLPAEGAVVTSHFISVVISFSLITVLHIVLGEFAPKGFALQRSEATALFVAPPMTIFLTIFRPIVSLFNGIGNILLRLLGLDAGVGEKNVRSVEELRYLVKSSREAGILESAEEEIASRALSLGDLTAHGVMVPRTEMISVPVDISLQDLLFTAGKERHVRFPVYEENTDNIAGIVYLTDIFAWNRTHPGKPFTLRAAMRPPLFVPESVKGDHLLSQMRAARTHTAIVVDEFGGVAGMVTLQDLLERIVGEIPEIGDNEEPDIETMPDGSVRIDGLTPLSDVEERFALKLDDIEAETVGGYVLETLGRVPDVGDELDLDNYRLRVTEMDGPRVAEIVLSK